jgi:hypothetical protein
VELSAAKPDPGTDEANELGCTCPPNSRQPAPVRFGINKGYSIDDWMCVRPDCRLHGWRTLNAE